MPVVYLPRKVDADAARCVYDIKANPPEYMTIDELSCYLSISKSNLYRMKREGNLPFVKVGNSLRFERSAIKRWIEKTNA